ncbi:MAG TPA: methyl-accepting chemotaxis protein, partial [Mycobacteriales bacterium]|nr:methyl-accepting chemotaxis protein [Mycobacteriales bacterium]
MSEMMAWHRISWESRLASEGKLVGAAVAVYLMSHYGLDPVHEHRNIIYIWLAVGVVPVIMQRLTPWMMVHSPGVEVPYLVTMGLVDQAVGVAVVALSGGVNGPFWVMMLVTTAGAAVIAPNQVMAVGQSLLMTGSLVLATWIAHDLTSDATGPLILVGASAAMVAMLGNAVASRLEVQRLQSDTERDQLRKTVEDLSLALGQAAQGDLSVRVESESVAQELLSRLATAFDDTLGNLRGLVGKIRNGGEQIVAAAHQLLASAEEHAASATEQSSAVSQTTSTIEELAATAAQIADTAEAVSRYAAETLRHAEDGRVAVSASVDAMDTIADRVEQIGSRALSLGEKGQE